LKRGRDKYNDRDINRNYLSRIGQSKGQITMFVILGIVILVVIIFAVSVASSFSKKTIKAESEKAVEAYLQSEAVSYYVYTCMDSAVTSAIQDLALQGGRFYTYQNGTYNASLEGATHIPYNLTLNAWNETDNTQRIINVNVSYSVLNNSYCELVAPEPFAYPYDKTPISSLYSLYNTYSINGLCLYNLREGYALSGFAGFNNMTRLCYIGSNNTKSIGIVDFTPCGVSMTTDENKAIELLLANQISIRMKNCTDFSVFVDDNITVLDSPTTKIIYTSESLMVRTTYNLSVKIKNKEPVIVKHSFEYKTDLRLVRMHNYIMTLVRAESSDFFFNLFNNYETYGAHNEINPEKYFDKEHMSVRIINFTDCPDCPYRYDRLLIVEDNKSIIENKSLTYMTVLKNRRPALDFVHSTIAGSYYDIVVSNNQEITLNPMGYDPDDGPVSYDYEGWKEDYDDNCRVESSDEGMHIVCERNDNVAPKNWTISDMFNHTLRSANYKTSLHDMGEHNVTITTTDESGLQDYQVVHILVFDLPEAVMSIEVYSDTPSGIASVEDRIVLDGTGSINSQIGQGTITAYNWKVEWMDSNPIFVVVNQAINAQDGGSSLTLPIEAYDYSNRLDELIQIIKPLELSHLGQHNVTLVVQSPVYGNIVDSLPDSENLNVKECVFHENEFDPYPFPYNNGPDPFDATHLCCDASNNLKDGSSTCYQATRYGEYNQLRDLNIDNNDKFTTYAPFGVYNIPYINLNSNNINNVYKLEFERFCDGKRGNICAGPIVASIESIEDCKDRSAVEEETCAGPSYDVSEDEMTCQNYAPGNSFERTFGIGSGTGICNTNKVCSTLGLYGYGVSGPMLCQATCNGRGDCSNTRTTNNECSCSTQCGAVCTSISDFRREPLNVCRSNCIISSSCTYSKSTPLPCTDADCRSATDRYCYSGVGCTGSGATFVRGEYCATGIDVDPARQDICRYLPPATTFTDDTACTADGYCRLSEQSTTTMTPCPSGQHFSCTSTGWVCVV
jgi:hypothetical protein